MAEGSKVQGFFTYAFVGALLVLMMVMLATTPLPEWMDGSGDEGPTIGGPLIHQQEVRMPWTFQNGRGPAADEDEGEGEADEDGQRPTVGYGSRTAASSEPGTYGIHVTGRDFQTAGLAQAQTAPRGIRQRKLSARSSALRNPLTSSQLRAVTTARHKSKAFYTQGDKTVPV